MSEDLTLGRARGSGTTDIMPFLEDQLFGQEEELERFTLDSDSG